MGYYVSREGNKGLFYVQFQQAGEKVRRIKKSSPDWQRLGFDSCKTIEDARDLARTLNKQDKVRRTEARRLRIQEKLEEAGLLRCAWLPPHLLIKFEGILRTYKIQRRFWESSKLAIIEMGQPPSEWKAVSFRFYDFCAKRAWSLKYANTIRRAMNAWSEFYGKETGTRNESIPFPTGAEKSAIVRAYEGYKGRRRKRPSGRLSFKLLEENKGKFSEEEYNWLFISIAFGLRPEEINKSLKDPSKHHINRAKKVLHVYQFKLERTETNPLKRWKKISVVLAEQTKALDLIESGAFKMPRSLGGIKDGLGRDVTQYGGRKEFFPVMSKKFNEADASRWLGHRSLDTSRKFYDDPFTNAPGMDDEDDEAA